MHRRALFLSAALVALASANANPASGQELIMGMKGFTTSADPHFHYAGENNGFLEHFHARLVQEDPQLNLTPGLAVSWRLVNDTTWEFKLRPDARFSDGTPFTGNDVAYSFARIPRIENSPGSYQPFVRPIREVRIIDPQTIHLITAQPHPFVPADMAKVFILPASIGQDAKTADFNAGRITVGSGPFRLTEFRIGERVTMERNPHYYGPAAPWSRVTIRSIRNDTARVAALYAGDVQAIDEVPVAELERLRRDQRFGVHQTAGARVMYVAFDMDRDASPYIRDNQGRPMTRNPLKDARVRLAISHAINRQAIAERVMEGAAVPASNLLPTGAPGTSPRLQPVRFDPERARALLREAGYPDGFQLTIHATNDRYPNDSKVAQALGQMLTRIGIQTSVELQPNAVYFAAASRQAFTVMAAQYGSSDVTQSYRALVHTFDRERGFGSANRTRHSNPAADAMFREAITIMDEGRRNAALERVMDKAIGEDATILMLYHPSYIYAAPANLVVTPHAAGPLLAHLVRRR